MKFRTILWVPVVFMVGCVEKPVDNERAMVMTSKELYQVWEKQSSQQKEADEIVYRTLIAKHAGSPEAMQVRLNHMRELMGKSNKKEFMQQYEQYKTVYTKATDQIPAEMIYADWVIGFYDKKVERWVGIKGTRNIDMLHQTYRTLAALKKQNITRDQQKKVAAKLDQIQTVMELNLVATILQERKNDHAENAQFYYDRLKKWFPKSKEISPLAAV